MSLRHATNSDYVPWPGITETPGQDAMPTESYGNFGLGTTCLPGGATDGHADLADIQRAVVVGAADADYVVMRKAPIAERRAS